MSSACFAPTAPARLDGQVRVLVVEDDPVQATVLLLFLERLGVRATLVTDGQQAVRAAKAGGFGLVLMDYVMPLKDGVQATQAIRRWEAAAGREPVPIVAVTASAMHDECQRYLDAGMDRILLKPFSARELSDVLQCYLPMAWLAEASALG